MGNIGGRNSTFMASLRSGLSRRSITPFSCEYFNPGDIETGDTLSVKMNMLGSPLFYRLQRHRNTIASIFLLFFFGLILFLSLRGSSSLGFGFGQFDDNVEPKINANWSRGSIKVNGIQLTYYKTEDSTNYSVHKPKLVFLHGLTMSGAGMISLLSDLSNDFEVFLPDARGHGGSQPIPYHSFTMPNLVRDAAEAVTFFSGGEKVFLAGHSMGASTAARLLIDSPHLFKAAVLEDPPWLRLAGEPVAKPNRPLPQMFHLAEELQKSPAPVSSQNSKVSPLSATYLQCLRQFDVEEIKDTFTATDDIINEAVPEISVPTLLQTGGPEAVCKPRVAQETLRTWANGTEKNFAGAPHVIHSGKRRELWLEVTREYLLQFT